LRNVATKLCDPYMVTMVGNRVKKYESIMSPKCAIINVCELMGWVRNVVLIKCIFGSGKPRGVGILGGRVQGPGEGTGE
jgi:hypothetical protein